MNIILLLLGFNALISSLFLSYMMVASIHKYFEKVQGIITLDKGEIFHDDLDLDGMTGSPVLITMSLLINLIITDLIIYNSTYFVDNDFYSKDIYMFLIAQIHLVLVMGCIYAVWKKLIIKYNFYKIYEFNGRYSAVKYGGSWLGSVFGVYWLFFKRLWIPAIILSCGYILASSLIGAEILNVPTDQVIARIGILFHLGVGHYGNSLVEKNYVNKSYNLVGTIKSHSEKNAVKDFLFTNNIIRTQKEIGLLHRLQIQQSLISTAVTTILGVVTYLITHFVFGFGIPEASISSILISSILGFFGYKA